MLLPTMTIDITTTKSCNFACSYCFESGMHESKHTKPEVYDKIIKFMKEHRYLYNIMIMGGEPSTTPYLKYFFKRLKEEIQNKNLELIPLNKNGSSVYITNGYKIKNIYNHFGDSEEEIEFWKKYFQIQISYDGKIINDKYRKTIDGKLTSNKVLENFKILHSDNFYTTLKSTINIQDFIYLKDTILEFKEIKEQYNVNYNITENKDSFEFITQNKIKELIKENFSEVLKIEKDFYLKNKKFITKWFNESKLEGPRVKCSAGTTMFHIDTQGNTQPCHLSLYNKNKINYGDINNEFLKNFKKNKNYFFGLNEDKCKDCAAVICNRCPMHNYNKNSSLINLYNGIESKDNNVCFYYQEISKYIYYLKKQLNTW